MGKFARWSAPEGLSLLAAWTRAGCSAGEIARRCGVREAVLLGWAQRCPGVEAALRTTGEMADAQVENALLRRALGYCYTEVTEEENGSGVKRRETHKYEPPNLTAIKFWLACRLPEKWGARLGEAEAKNGLDALLAALDAQAGEEEAP